MDREAWRAAVQGIAKSQIWLKDWTEEIIAKNLQSLAKDINLYCCSVGKLCSTLRDPENYSTPSSSVLHYLSVQVSSVTQSCLTLCSPMDCSMPGFPVPHQLLEFIQTHVHGVSNTIQPSYPLSSPSLPTFNLSQHQGLFQWVSLFHQVAKVLEFQLQHQSFQWTPRTDLL